MDAKPFLIKPNAKEFADLAGKEQGKLADFSDVATKVFTRHQTMIAVSLGAEGASAANQISCWLGQVFSPSAILSESHTEQGHKLQCLRPLATAVRSCFAEQKRLSSASRKA